MINALRGAMAPATSVMPHPSIPSYRPEDIALFFLCPDDRGPLALEEGITRCLSCGRSYALRGPGILELMPSKPVERPLATEFYKAHFFDRWEENEKDLPWGHPDILPPRIRRHYAFMGALVGRVAPASGGAFLDISAGNATLSLPLAGRFKAVVLADFSAGSAAWLGRQGKTLVVRADYLQTPYADGVFDFILCTDTLIYGREHEERLLKNLWAALKPGGKALLSFHHRHHHNPLTPPIVVGYSRAEIEEMLAALSPVPHCRFHRYYQEFSGNLAGGRWWERGIRAVFPATRYFVEAAKPGA